MISKREKWLWIIYASLLVILFLLSSTNLLIKEKKNEVYPISVVIADSNDDYYLNYKKGIDRAAMEYGADVNFITLYNKSSLKQQLELIQREYQDGAQALIISPVNDLEIIKFFDENEITIPIIVIESQMKHNKIAVTIASDAFLAGQQLANEVIQRQSAELPVYVFHSGMQYQSNFQIYDGLRSVFAKAGYDVFLQEGGAGPSYQNVCEEVRRSKKREATMIALDLESLTFLAELLDQAEETEKQMFALYGFGSTLPVLSYMDKGVIEGISATDRFIEGYLSVQKAVEVIRERGNNQNVTIDTVYVDHSEIRNHDNQKMLFPID